MAVEKANAYENLRSHLQRVMAWGGLIGLARTCIVSERKLSYGVSSGVGWALNIIVLFRYLIGLTESPETGVLNSEPHAWSGVDLEVQNDGLWYRSIQCIVVYSETGRARIVVRIRSRSSLCLILGS